MFGGKEGVSSGIKPQVGSLLFSPTEQKRLCVTQTQILGFLFGPKKCPSPSLFWPMRKNHLDFAVTGTGALPAGYLLAVYLQWGRTLKFIAAARICNFFVRLARQEQIPLVVLG